jgi:hypothetical protein
LRAAARILAHQTDRVKSGCAMYNQCWCLGVTLAYRLQFAAFGDSFSRNGPILPPNR